MNLQLLLVSVSTLIVTVLSLEFEKGYPYQSCQTSTLFLDLEEIVGPIYSESLSSLCNVRVITISESWVSLVEKGGLCASPFKSMFIRQNFLFPNLTQDLFGNCPTLKTLGLHDNAAIFVEPKAFSGLTNLTQLILEDVKLNHITKQHFVNLHQLEKLKIVDSGVTSVDPDAFGDLRNLKELHLVKNNISKIDGVLTSLRKLITLDLSGNRITKFPWSGLENLPNLGDLDISNNLITIFDVEKIGNLVDLKNFTASINPVSCSLRKNVTEELKTKIKGLEVEFKLSFELYPSNRHQRPTDCPTT